MPHIHEKIDFTAEVFIVYKNKILLRKHDKYHIWIGVGGHIELHEDPIEAAIREVKEEVGLDIHIYQEYPIPKNYEGYTELIPPQFLNRHRISPTHEHISFVYFASSGSDRIIQPDREKAEWKWFDEKELDDPKYAINENIRIYARKALAVLRT